MKAPPRLAFLGVFGSWLLVSTALVSSGCESGKRELREWTAADHGQPAQADPERVPQETGQAEGGETRAAAALWSMSCATCHGTEGRGDGPGKPPGVQVPDLSAPAWQKQRDDAAIAQVIAKGKGAMPAFGQQLTDPGIQALVRHVRTLGGEGASAQGEGPEPAPAQPDAQGSATQGSTASAQPE